MTGLVLKMQYLMLTFAVPHIFPNFSSFMCIKVAGDVRRVTNQSILCHWSCCAVTCSRPAHHIGIMIPWKLWNTEAAITRRQGEAKGNRMWSKKDLFCLRRLHQDGGARWDPGPGTGSRSPTSSFSERSSSIYVRAVPYCTYTSQMYTITSTSCKNPRPCFSTGASASFAAILHWLIVVVKNKILVMVPF